MSIFEVSDTDESVLDLNEILKVELGEWIETIIALKEQDNVYDRQLEQSQQPRPLLSPYIQDIVQKGESRDCARLKNMAGLIHGTDKSREAFPIQ